MSGDSDRLKQFSECRRYSAEAYQNKDSKIIEPEIDEITTA